MDNSSNQAVASWECRSFCDTETVVSQLLDVHLSAVESNDGRTYRKLPSRRAIHAAMDTSGRMIKGHARHPILEDGVVVYAGATIVGRITIGRNSVIGGNVWLTKSVSPGSQISQARVRTEHFDEGGGI